MRLTINLATRERPERLIPTIETTLANITLAGTTLMISADADDEATVEALRPYIGQCAVSIRDREDTLGEKFNRALNVAPADVYMTMVDYAPILTRGFDAIVLAAAARWPDGYAVVTGNFANLSFPSLQAVTAKLAARLGGIWPEYFPYWFGDHWVDDIMRMIERTSYAPVAVDCASRRPGRTHALREPGWWATYYDACHMLRVRQARGIIDDPAFEETAARKAALPHNFELVRQRARMINDVLRLDGAAIEATRGAGVGPPDARYARAKARAIAALRAEIADMPEIRGTAA
jgi:hypothetical protein